MKRPLQILQEQVTAHLCKASVDEARTIKLSDNEFEALKSNFRQLCYEISFGQLDEIYLQLVNDESHRNGIFSEQDLNNILLILETIKAAE